MINNRESGVFMPTKTINQIKLISFKLKELEQLKNHFDKSSAKKKMILIRWFETKKILNAKMLTTYHDTLSFIRAYPDNSLILKAVDRELFNFGKRVDLYKKETRDKNAAKLLNSGISGSTVEHPFSLGVIKLLLKYYPKKLSVDWENLLESVPDEIFSTLPLLLAWHENDALDNDDYTDVPGWLKIAGQKKSRSDIETLVKIFTSSAVPSNIQDYLFEKFEIPIEWNLNDSNGSRSKKRLPFNKVFYQREPIIRRTSDLRAEFTKPAKPLKLLSERRGKELVQQVNEVLAVRYRELHPLTYANPKEVYLYEPGRGVQIYLFGSIPEIRLPLESNFGAMLVRNGLPIGYGVGATLLERVEIAINIFPAFRTGESSFIIEHFFKLFYNHFGSRVFLVNKFQMGDGDDEPIHSGAFWFYYKLGFRAVKQKIRRMAEKEHSKIKSHKNYRSSFQTLKRLSKSDVFLHFEPDQMNDFHEISLMNLGYIVTRSIGKHYHGDRALATNKSVAKLEKSLSLRGWQKWPEGEIHALKRMAPLLSKIPGLSKWSLKDKKNLIEIIRAKGCTTERKYAILSTKHTKYINALWRLSQVNTE
ncbi:hypothetical protein ACFLQG_00090 [Candidatus Zixiibacteriota bacterium]